MRYRPKALTDAIFISPGEVFRDIDITRTYRYINQLRVFKYPNIDPVENDDLTITDTIRLTPLKKFNFNFSTDVSQSNIQTIGFSLNPSLQIRNIFKGAETLEISGIASIGASKEKEDGDPFFDINEFGADLKLTIPRLFSPFYTENIIPKFMSPSTRIGLATTSQRNIGLDPAELIGTDRNGDNILNINSADAFIDLALGDTFFERTNPTEYATVSSIEERKNRLTENKNLIT